MVWIRERMVEYKLHRNAQRNLYLILNKKTAEAGVQCVIRDITIYMYEFIHY